MIDLLELSHSLKILYKLKDLKREGWLRRGVPPNVCESVAGHCYRTAQAGFHYTRDRELVQMLALHDWPEAISGDPTPADKIAPQIKHQREYAAMQYITQGLPYGERLMSIWLEYEDRTTPRAQLAHQLDKLDAAVMAFRYEARGYSVAEFYPYARERVQNPALLRVFDTLLKRKHDLRDSHRVYFRLLEEARRDS